VLRRKAIPTPSQPAPASGPTRVQNLESALAVANRINDQKPTPYSWDIIATIYLKMKKYDEAASTAAA